MNLGTKLRRQDNWHQVGAAALPITLFPRKVWLRQHVAVDIAATGSLL